MTYVCCCRGTHRLASCLQIESLEVSSATEGMELLLQSERVYVDITRAVGVWAYEAVHPPTERDGTCPVTLQVVVRDWDSKLTIRGEYRAFVVGRRLTALSQYFECLCFPHLQTDAGKRGTTSYRAGVLSI